MGIILKIIINLMRYITITFLTLTILLVNSFFNTASSQAERKLMIITMDGVRWSEIFTGIDKSLLNCTGLESSEHLTDRFWDEDFAMRRKVLMPFVWSYIAKHGALYGNRNFQNKVDVKNFFKISYPGYNEIFALDDKGIVASNADYNNPNITVLEYLNKNNNYRHSIAAFTSWYKFKYIYNIQRSNFYLSCNYNVTGELADCNQNLEEIKNILYKPNSTKEDGLTFLEAKDYIMNYHPKVVHIGFGESDEYAHKGDYSGYIMSINSCDKFIEDLWQLIQ